MHREPGPLGPGSLGHFWAQAQKMKKKKKCTLNKNTLTGPANCKKTTRHHAHLSLCAKSRKTNDASRENGQKPQFGQFFDNFDVKYLQIANFSEK